MKYDDGEVINDCQKPIELARLLISNHISPGGNVLVLGSGAGGEVLGAVAAGCNVVCVEKDEKQYNGLIAHLVKTKNAEIAADEKKEQKAIDDDQEEENSQETAASTGTKPSVPEESQGAEDEQVCRECAEVIVPPINYDFCCARCVSQPVFHPNCVEKTADSGEDYWCHTCIGEFAIEHDIFQDLGLGEVSESEKTYYMGYICGYLVVFYTLYDVCIWYIFTYLQDFFYIYLSMLFIIAKNCIL